MMEEQKKYYSLDRLEDGFAVLLDDEGEALTLPLDAFVLPGPGDTAPEALPSEEEADALPSAPDLENADAAQPDSAFSQEDAPPPADKRPVREGDILVQVNGRWLRDDAEAARRRKRNAALLANLRRRSALK